MNGKAWTEKEIALVKSYINKYESHLTDLEIAQKLTSITSRTLAALCTRISKIRNNGTDIKEESDTEAALVFIAQVALDGMSSETRRELLSDYIQF